jgi:small subunit ribosomal protein S1
MNSESTPSNAANPSFSAEDFAKALEQHDYQFQTGQTVRGKPFEYDGNGAYVDIGGKSPGFVPLREAALNYVSVTELPEVLPPGEERDFLIVRGQNEEGQVTLSVRQMELQQSWERLATRQENGEAVEMRITGTNKGGVTGEVEGLRAFIPRSHLLERHNLDSLIGQSVTANFLEVDPERNKLVLSQRSAARASRMSNLATGDVVEGEVVNLKPYGAFVDLNGVTGLLHIKEMSKSHINSVEDLFQVGQAIKVVVKEIDEWQDRISLSTKVLENYPGEIIDNLDDIMANAEERWEQAQQPQDE